MHHMREEIGVITCVCVCEFWIHECVHACGCPGHTNQSTLCVLILKIGSFKECVFLRSSISYRCKFSREHIFVHFTNKPTSAKNSFAKIWLDTFTIIRDWSICKNKVTN